MSLQTSSSHTRAHTQRHHTHTQPQTEKEGERHTSDTHTHTHTHTHSHTQHISSSLPFRSPNEKSGKKQTWEQHLRGEEMTEVKEVKEVEWSETDKTDERDERHARSPGTKAKIVGGGGNVLSYMLTAADPAAYQPPQLILSSFCGDSKCSVPISFEKGKLPRAIPLGDCTPQKFWVQDC